MMMAHQHIARWMGILYIAGTVAGIFSRVLIASALDLEDTLGQVAVIGNQITLAALMVMTMGIALALIPVVAYPVLKQHDEILALGYVIFRGALEGVAYMGVVVSWLFLLPLSQAYQSGIVDLTSAQVLAKTLLEGSELGVLVMIVFSVGGLLLYALLYRTKLVPRWLAGWGLLAILLNFAAGLLVMFGVFSPISATSTILQLPIFVQEITLALWLIVKGFNSESVARRIPVPAF